MPLFSNKKIDPQAEKRLRAMTEELDIRDQAFQDEARIRVRRLQNEIEETRHEINVSRSEIKEEVRRGLEKINAAAEAIDFPED